ncbi:MAG: Lpp/OprI family alanine-zipper lipoprotein [Gammaproteobacteria bacterium]|nr:Lpp/OprI family alanine-zipper lipoprotein [Gammaproteobacteria bacterium]
MNQKFSKSVRFALIVAAVGLASGCASTKKMEEVEAMAQSAQQSAEQAAAAARSAQQTADQALEAAKQANTCCQNNSQKIDQMFKKSMMK